MATNFPDTTSQEDFINDLMLTATCDTDAFHEAYLAVVRIADWCDVSRCVFGVDDNNLIELFFDVDPPSSSLARSAVDPTHVRAAASAAVHLRTAQPRLATGHARPSNRSSSVTTAFQRTPDRSCCRKPARLRQHVVQRGHTERLVRLALAVSIHLSWELGRPPSGVGLEP